MVPHQPLADLALGQLRVDGPIEAAQHLHQDLQRERPERLLLLRVDHALMLIFGQFAVCNLGKTLDDLLTDVQLADVAVIVDENLQEHHRVLADFVEDGQDQVLVVV